VDPHQLVTHTHTTQLQVMSSVTIQTNVQRKLLLHIPCISSNKHAHVPPHIL